jgi:hypothetical protein
MVTSCFLFKPRLHPPKIVFAFKFSPKHLSISKDATSFLTEENDPSEGFFTLVLSHNLELNNGRTILEK